jgi:hypothetical protein
MPVIDTAADQPHPPDRGRPRPQHRPHRTTSAGDTGRQYHQPTSHLWTVAR